MIELVSSSNTCLEPICREQFPDISLVYIDCTLHVADVAFSASTLGISSSKNGTRMSTPDGKQSFVVTSTKGVTINADQKKLLAITGNKGNDTFTKTGSADVMFKGGAMSDAVNTRCISALSSLEKDLITMALAVIGSCVGGDKFKRAIS